MSISVIGNYNPVIEIYMIIYRTICLINNKIYIGQDTNDNSNYLGSGVKFLCALKAYGKVNFKKETLCRCKTQESLDTMEKFFIAKFNATNSEIGYNILLGTANEFGSGSPMKNEEVAKKVSETLKKRFKEHPKLGEELSERMRKLFEENPELRERFSAVGKTLVGKKNPNFGNKWSEEQKRKSSKKMKGRYDGKKNPNFGNKWSEEQKRKSSEFFDGKYSGKKNPMFGKVRITNGVINTVMKKSESLPEGFRYGMKLRDKK